jgi:hypothetical protein
MTKLDTTIDLGIDPRPYNEWRIKEHKKGGQFEWDSAKVDLFLHEKQWAGGITGKSFARKLLLSKLSMLICWIIYWPGHPSFLMIGRWLKMVKPVTSSSGVRFTTGHLIRAFMFVVCTLVLADGEKIIAQLITPGPLIASP